MGLGKVRMEFDKTTEIQKLYERVIRCDACPLADTRQNVVFGEGDINAEILLFGEGPGENEDTEGRPFIGDAGKMLNSLLVAASIERAKIYISNTVRCRAVDPLGNNRIPTKAEIAACKPFMLELIRVIDPVVIVAAGKIPSAALGGFRRLKDATSDLYDITIPGVTTELVYPVMSIHHPSDLLRRAHNRDLSEATIDQLNHLRKTLNVFRKLGRGMPYITGAG